MKNKKRNKDEELARLLLAVFVVLVLVAGAFLTIISPANAKSLTHDQIVSICKKYDYDKCDLLSAISFKESSYITTKFNPEKSGSFGLMQIQCDTAKGMGLKYGCDQLFDDHINIRFSVLYLKLIEKVLKPKTVDQIVAAWNAHYTIKNGIAKNKRCKNYNVFVWHGAPEVECYPGEYINQEYVWKVMRRYNYLKGRRNPPPVIDLNEKWAIRHTPMAEGL